MITAERKQELRNELQRARRERPADFLMEDDEELVFVMKLLKKEEKN